jgi:hypothetical protein
MRYWRLKKSEVGKMAKQNHRYYFFLYPVYAGKELVKRPVIIVVGSVHEGKEMANGREYYSQKVW